MGCNERYTTAQDFATIKTYPELNAIETKEIFGILKLSQSRKD